MQRLGSPWLSHALPSRTLLPKVQLRFKRVATWPIVPARKKFKIFEVSRPIIDLDAEDNKNVRPYDEDVDSIPADPLVSGEVARKHAADFEELSRQYEEQFQSVATNKFSPWRISNYDILSVALDNSSVPETNDAQQFIPINHRILKMNGIQTRVLNNNSKTIAYMLRRQQIAQRLQPGAAGDKELLRTALQECRDTLEVERLITNVIQTRQGCRLVSACSGFLGRRCEAMGATTIPTLTLPFFNNLIITLDSQGLQFATSLVWQAYWASLRIRAFSTAQKYMKIIRERGVALDEQQTFDTLKILEKSIVSPGPYDIRAGVGEDTTHKLLAIYSLLTGRIFGEETTQEPSLQDLILNTKNWRVYGLYVKVLVQLGAFRTMWYLWHTRPDLNGVSLTKASKTDVNSAMVNAFVHAIREVVRNNTSYVCLAENPNFTLTAGGFGRDCQLDMEGIVNSTEILSNRKTRHVNRVGPKNIISIFGKQTVEEAMLALKSYMNEISSGISSGAETNDTDTEHNRLPDPEQI